MKKFIIRLLAIIAIGLPFMDTAARRARRTGCVYPTQDTFVGINVLTRPMPWQ